MTKRLYFDDPYQIHFEARVLKRENDGDKSVLILDQTCFYPTSGGQESDHGTLNGIPVTDVIARNDTILHMLDDMIEEDSIQGRIEWKRRFDFMQQHSGQHLLSRSFLDVLGANTVSSHLGEEFSTIELGRETLTREEAAEVEKYANKIVFENRPIKTYIVDEDKLSDISLRRTPKKNGPIRVVEFEDLDYTPCGGTHCWRTGEIGLIKTGRCEKIRGHVRVQFLCGSRAVADYRWKSDVVDTLGEQFSARGEDLPVLVIKQTEELKDLRRQIKDFSLQAMEYEVQELLAGAQVFSDMRVVQAVFQGRSPDDLKNLAVALSAAGSTVALLGNRSEKGQLVFSCSAGLPLQMNEFIRVASEKMGGRGGGKPELAFGGGPQGDKTEEVLDSVFQQIRKEL